MAIWPSRVAQESFVRLYGGSDWRESAGQNRARGQVSPRSPSGPGCHPGSVWYSYESLEMLELSNNELLEVDPNEAMSCPNRVNSSPGIKAVVQPVPIAEKVFADHGHPVQPEDEIGGIDGRDFALQDGGEGSIGSGNHK
ncbi:hypothetical protein C8F04DRAFT_1183391 [Mycena alexandri]|uniref:Uncharacterized protein n=1 Tax=Mycena alexandri TaxID=1745969 RepID=A0AAD6SX36_9AGAR|nr:hypothetical protein C8F04DRAFT_1183391 [Mycena alexandri]